MFIAATVPAMQNLLSRITVSVMSHFRTPTPSCSAGWPCAAAQMHRNHSCPHVHEHTDFELRRPLLPGGGERTATTTTSL